MTEHPMISKWAALLTDYCLDVQPKQSVMISSSTIAEPLVRALHNTILQRGAYPILRLSYPEQLEDFYTHATDAQLDQAPNVNLLEMGAIDATLRILADSNTKSLTEIDSSLQTRMRRANLETAKIRQTKRWCLTLFPTNGFAQDAGMNLEQFTAFVYRAMFLDRPDPVAAWQEIHTMQAALIERLSRAKTVRLEADGTDITLEVGGRVWRNSDGKRNMPSGEVFTGPHEQSANGFVKFTVPSSVHGHDVSGVQLEFKDGLVVNASSDTGQNYLLKSLETDAGAKRLGELGIGTNYGIQRGIKEILFDEKIGGTVHLALGSSYPETLGTNESALHWDLILDVRGGGRISLDGEVFQENGKFV
jgi:aminopeptidase